MRACAADQRLDVEGDALLGAALEIIGADLGFDDKIAHEHAVEFAFLLASADEAARQQPPVDLGRSVGVRPLARDQIANQRDRLRVDRAPPIVPATKRAAKAEHVRTHEQQARNVGRLQRAGETRDQARRAAAARKTASSCATSRCVRRRPRLLSRVSSIAPLKPSAVSLASSAKSGVSSANIMPTSATSRASRQASAETCERRRVHGEFDVVDAHRREARARAARARPLRKGDRRASRSSCADRATAAIAAAAASSATAPSAPLPRVFEIDDVGASRSDDARPPRRRRRWRASGSSCSVFRSALPKKVCFAGVR